MKNRVVEHFIELYSYAPHTQLVTIVDFDLQVFAKVNVWFYEYPREEEIKHSLFSMPFTKVLDLDGITVEFLRHQWDLIKSDN